jgi:drug/metabolite transporter (DMT)-like permease
VQLNKKGPLFIALTAILWSFGGVLIKLVPWDAMTIIGMRAALGAIVVAVYMKKPRIHLRPSVILGALCLSGTTILFVFANKLTTAANAIMLQYTEPVFVILLMAVFLKKLPKALDITAVLAVFGGIALFFIGHLQSTAVLGNVLAVLSGLTFAGVFVVNQMPDACPEESVLLSMIINVAVAAPFIATNITFEPVAWVSIVLLGVFQIGLAYVLFSIGIKITPPVTASLIAAIEPILNPVWVFMVTGENPGVWAIVGGIIVILVVVGYNVITTRRTRYASAEGLPQDAQ